MALDALLFDIDGTLLDTNWAHVEAWQHAFAARGYRIARDRIEVEIGKGGDKLVPSILGQEAEQRDGEALREQQQREFARLGREKGFAAFPFAMELLTAARARKLKLALATSSSKQHLKVLQQACSIDLERAADVITSADDAAQSKPAPDLVSAAVAKLELSPAQCAMVGDTLYDMEAAKRAGVIGLGILAGYQSPATLRRSGARVVWKDMAQLYAELDTALDLASPTTVRLTQSLLESLMHDALVLAERARLAAEAPIGCVIADGEARVIAGANQQVQGLDDLTAHAELIALRAAAGKLSTRRKDGILICTREPCVMCLGAAMQGAIDSIIYGISAPQDSGTARVTPPETESSQMPRIVGGILESECRALYDE